MPDTTRTQPRSASPWGDPALDAAIRDGCANAVMLGCGEAYLGPFGIFLHATTLQIGVLSALPQLLGAVMQWRGALAMDGCSSRLRWILRSVLLQALVWFPLAAIALSMAPGPTVAGVVIVLAVASQVAAGFAVPVWNSLIGDMVPGEIRGRFFGVRNRINGLSSFLALTGAGLILHLFERVGRASWGFGLIFAAAGAARLASRHWLGHYPDPPWSLDAADVFTFRQFIRRSPRSNFAKFVFYVGAVNMAVAFSAPYFALYMLRDLRFSYLEFTVVVSVATMTQFLMFRYWGELSDRFGNKKILTVCGWGISMVPVLWLFSFNILYLMVAQVASGVIWAGFSLASSNFLFDAVSPPKRARCVAYQGLINGAAVLAGSLGGGFVAGHLPTVFSLDGWSWAPRHTLPVIFLLSGVMRFVAAFLMLHKFREVRPVEAIRHRDLIYRVSHIRPVAGATFSLLTGTFGRTKASGQETKSSFSAKHDEDDRAR